MMAATGAPLGHVDRADKYAIGGWALDPSKLGDQVKVEIVQNGRSVISVLASLPTPTLLKALNLESPREGPARYGWQVTFPLANGVVPDQPFDVRIVGTQTPLPRGHNVVIATAAGVEPEVLEDFASEQFLLPHYHLSGTELHLSIRSFAIDGSDAVPLRIKGPVAAVDDPTAIDAQENRFLNRQCFFQRFVVSPGESGDEEAAISVPPRSDRSSDLLRSIHIPNEIFRAAPDLAPLPDLANIKRIGGPSASQLTYLIGGRTAYTHLDLISQAYFGRSLGAWPRVLDWGVGCARVLRYFTESGQTLAGADIDTVNVEWCRRHVGASVQVMQLDTRQASLPLDDASIDMMYGISVVTHLSEHHHHLWLRELKRVMRPGGMVVLTTHGEFALFRAPSSIALPIVEQFGFFDGAPDFALGADLASYYRTTYHARRYVREHWRDYFEILATITGASAFLQDYVVMKA